MSKISLDPNYLRTQATVYDRACDQLMQIKNEVDRTNNEMAEHWKGAAFSAYLTQYSQIEGIYNEMRGLMQDVCQQAKNYANEIETRDAADARIFGLR